MDHHYPHVSLGDLEKLWMMFTEQKARSQQLLNSLQQKPLAPQLFTLSITGRVSKLGTASKHPVQPLHTHSDPTTEETSLLFNGMSPFKQMHQEKPLTLLRGHAVSWLTRNSHNQGCKGHQEKGQPAD